MVIELISSSFQIHPKTEKTADLYLGCSLILEYDVIDFAVSC